MKQVILLFDRILMMCGIGCTKVTYGYHDTVKIYVSLQLRVQNAVSAQPCVGKFRISLVLLNFLHCNFRLWFKTP